MYNHGSRIFFENPNVSLKLPGLCWFFHESQQFFKVFEMPGTSQSLNLIFFQNTRTQRFFHFEDFIIPGYGGSWIVISKYLEPAGI
jgi:hypothetical protein